MQPRLTVSTWSLIELSSCCGARPRETSESDPIVLGDPNGAAPIHARVNLNAYGRKAHEVAWWTGSKVDAAISGGTLTPV